MPDADGPPSSSTAAVKDDRILPINRFLHALFVVLVAPFFVGLIFFAEHTDKNFAWPIKPRMSAMMFGSLYLAVIYTYTRFVFAKKWHHVALIIWATLPVLSTLGVVTLMYWDKFTGPPGPFIVWFVAYLCVPPILACTLYLNSRHDPGTPDAVDVEVPTSINWSTGVIGVIFGIVGLALIIFPDQMIALWPWPLSPLTARGVGALFAAPTFVHALALFETRWSALRVVSEGALVWFAMILISVIRCWDEFDTSRWTCWAFVGILTVEWLFALLTYLGMERERLRIANIVSHPAAGAR